MTMFLRHSEANRDLMSDYPRAAWPAPRDLFSAVERWPYEGLTDLRQLQNFRVF
jgi:hypothetical protein